MDRVIYKPKKDFITNEEEKGKNPINSVIGNSFVKIVLIGVSLFLFYSIYNSVIITYQKIEISKHAREEVDKLRLENLKLALSLESMSSQEYIEVQARDRLNFSGSDEYIFVIPDSTLKSAQEQIQVFFSEPEEKTDTQVYEVWIDFLKNGI
ncbi:MAG TPA: septum formation initiator family protein [Candidatus Dojkabacteria bacterium]|nr:septum formation initiator family protein [Candidatus Dojkabacteria bacterium]